MFVEQINKSVVLERVKTQRTEEESGGGGHKSPPCATQAVASRKDATEEEGLFVISGQARGPGSRGVMGVPLRFPITPPRGGGRHTHSHATHHKDCRAAGEEGPWGRAGPLSEPAAVS